MCQTTWVCSIHSFWLLQGSELRWLLKRYATIGDSQKHARYDMRNIKGIKIDWPLCIPSALCFDAFVAWWSEVFNQTYRSPPEVANANLFKPS